MRTILSMIFSTAFFIQAYTMKVSVEALNYELICTEMVYFTAPSQTQFDVGDDIYVRLDCVDPQFIQSVRLYLGHQLVGTDGTAPYEWCKPNSSEHPALRDMQAGNYSLTAKVQYTCGNYRYFTKKIKVGFIRPALVFVGDLNLTWLTSLKHQHTDWSFFAYQLGAEIFIKADQCNRPMGQVIWYDRNGKISARFSRNSQYQGRFQSAKLVKVINSGCRS
ncbi:MAG: hypothetical protein KDC53_05615 [Saprospiraceae bacterium]|nr:hypothetical protein [Saprospiraceae bacterium]